MPRRQRNARGRFWPRPLRFRPAKAEGPPQAPPGVRLARARTSKLSSHGFAPRVNYPTTEELWEPYWFAPSPHRFQLVVKGIGYQWMPSGAVGDV